MSRENFTADKNIFIDTLNLPVVNRDVDKIKKNKERFFAALKKFKDNYGHGVQSYVAISAGVSPGYVSQLFKHFKTGNYENAKISFETQVKIAEAMGYDYLDFLQLGRELIEGSAEKPEPDLGPAVIEPSDPIVSIHQDLINAFQDKKLAKQINQNLIKIEAMSQKKYYMLAGKIENIAEELNGDEWEGNAKKTKTGENPNRHNRIGLTEKREGHNKVMQKKSKQ